MPTTSNFGWTTPADTDLVKDGAAAIRTLGSGIDTSLVDLKGGTTGQILSKASNSDLDYAWINNDQGDITEVTVSSPLTGGGSSGSVNVAIQDGTTAQKGAVQLEDSTSSTSTTKAATPNSVKSSYDLANGAIPKSLVDAAGDIIYATADNTVARLGIGTAGQVLKVNSGASAPEWGAASAGALSLITKSTFTTVTSHGVNNCFTSTYANYKILIKWTAQSGDNVDLSFKMRASGTDTTTNYDSQRIFGTASSVSSDLNNLGTDEFLIGVADKDFATATFTEIEIASPQLATNTTMLLRSYGYTTAAYLHIVGGAQKSSTQFDGFTLFASTGTMSGTIWVYGYQEA